MTLIIEEIRSILFKYLDKYFINRDLESTVKMFSPDISGYGTGGDEIASNYDEFKRLYSRDISEAPGTVYYNINRLYIKSPASNIGIASCELNIRTKIVNQELKLNNLRLTLILVKTKGVWLIEHMHLSFPTHIHEDNESYPIKELEERNVVLQRLVEEKTSHLNDALRQINKLAATDKLTGLYNRLKIDECIENELKRTERYNNKLSVIIIDIDYFKKINDSYGHLAGDQVLVEFAQVISQRIRQTDFIGRWGGEEFIVVCPETSLDNASIVAEDIRCGIEAYIFITVGRITVSIGVTSYQLNDTRDMLLSRVDAALYEAKRNGRNQVVVN
ncbi:MAG: diguanylate cyclase [Desulfamplus sp.]|nr:diguanylate cyclase [Desulfamplus sp.]